MDSSSLVFSMKRIGPEIDPCGTPIFKTQPFDLLFSTVTVSRVENFLFRIRFERSFIRFWTIYCLSLRVIIVIIKRDDRLLDGSVYMVFNFSSNAEFFSKNYHEIFMLSKNAPTPHNV